MARQHPQTPDGRYFVAKSRLWRRTDPRLDETERRAAIKALMRARRAVGLAATDSDRQSARDAVDAAKHGLGERGPVWWDDGTPDDGGKAPWNSRYADWWATLDQADRTAGTS